MTTPLQLTSAEIQSLKRDLEMLEGLETEFLRAEKIGVDVSEQRKRNRELIEQITVTLDEFGD